ncbi:hypothetical protein AAVH_09961 [Aphelenchoides avenae]|nr:hypothetical protein AAVH_09961 [Aphelenchus avenae]
MSEVWLYFTKSGAVANCNGCDFVAKETRDNRLKTSALWRHLQSKHPDVYERSAYGAEHPSERNSAGEGPPKPKAAKVDGAFPHFDEALQAADVSVCAGSAEADAEPASSKALLNRTNIPAKMPCKKVIDEAVFRRAASAGLPAPVPIRAKSLSKSYATPSRASISTVPGGSGLGQAKVSGYAINQG